MTREEAINMIKELIDTYITCHGEEDTIAVSLDNIDIEAFDMAIKALEQEPCCNCIEFKRYAKQMGFKVKTQSIPYLMQKEMDIPLLECQKAYDVAIEYLRRQGKVKG